MERYDETESRWLLPFFMRSDLYDVTLSQVIDDWGAQASADMAPLSIWDAIGTMAEADLDALAEDMAIPVYHAGFPLEKKRELVRRSRIIQSRLGTKWAVDETLGIYFSEPATVVEWFDYDGSPGEPGHFEVELTWGPAVTEEAKRFWPVLSSVKRAGAILDNVHVVFPATAAPVGIDAYPEDSMTVETTALIAKKPFVFGGVSALPPVSSGIEEHGYVETDARISRKLHEFGSLSAVSGPAARLEDFTAVSMEAAVERKTFEYGGQSALAPPAARLHEHETIETEAR